MALWLAQVVLALLMASGAVLKFMPIGKLSAMMPWTGQVPPILVRLLGLTDLLAALGLILPAALRVRPQLTPWAAAGTAALMVSATVFHLSRGEAAVVGMNVIAAAMALFVAWGRSKKAPVYRE